ncbi:hypothetical protein [Roseivivax sp. CAU 1753]
MTSPILMAFAISFAVGPLLFLALTAPAATTPLLAALAVGTLAMALLGTTLSPAAPLVGLACLWLAWISAVAFVTHTVRRIWDRTGDRGWIRVTGALATTVPWFGLATAQMLTQ